MHGMGTLACMQRTGGGFDWEHAFHRRKSDTHAHACMQPVPCMHAQEHEHALDGGFAAEVGIRSQREAVSSIRPQPLRYRRSMEVHLHRRLVVRVLEEDPRQAAKALGKVHHAGDAKVRIECVGIAVRRDGPECT